MSPTKVSVATCLMLYGLFNTLWLRTSAKFAFINKSLHNRIHQNHPRSHSPTSSPITPPTPSPVPGQTLPPSRSPTLEPTNEPSVPPTDVSLALWNWIYIYALFCSQEWFMLTCLISIDSQSPSKSPSRMPSMSPTKQVRMLWDWIPLWPWNFERYACIPFH